MVSNMLKNSNCFKIEKKTVIFSWNICKRDDSFRGTFFCFFSLGTKTSNRNQSTFFVCIFLRNQVLFLLPPLKSFQAQPYFSSGHLAAASLCFSLYARRSQAIIGPEKTPCWTPKNDGDWLEDDVSLTKKHSDFLLVPNGFFEGFLGFCFVIEKLLHFKGFLEPQTSCIFDPPTWVLFVD